MCAIVDSQCLEYMGYMCNFGGALRLWDLGHLWKAFGRRFVVEKYRHLSLCQIAKPWLAGNLDTLGSKLF